MKKKLLISLLLAAGISVFAQQDYNLLLKTGKFIPSQLTAGATSLHIADDEIGQSHVYRMVQFYEIPQNEAKRVLQEKGVNLIQYVPNNTYLAEVDIHTSLSELTTLGVRSVFRLAASYKISPELQSKELPAWAVSGNMIKVTVKSYSAHAFEEFKAYITQHNLEVLGSIDEINVLTVAIPIDEISKIAALPSVLYIEAIEAPGEKEDTEGRSLHRSNAIFQDGGVGRQYDGTGVSVALADDGAIGPHIDFEGRMVDESGVNSYGNHGDMTSGIMVGAGNLDPTIRGMASGAYLHYFDIGGYVHINQAVSHFNNDNVVVTSTSYSETNGGVYTSTTEAIDQQINQNPQLIHVFSAGNAGFSDHGYGAGAGWGNITGGRKAGKNVIACGNLNYLDALEGSSSRGPADDGRIKPDICSNGINQLSTDENNTYQTGGGTSAAAPGVAGVTTQLYHAYRENNGGANPETGLIKACMLNTAEDLGNPGPDFQHGWGRINALKAVRVIEDHRYMLDSVNQGGSNSHNITVPANVGQLRVMVYWMDVEGSTVASKALVNDINMQVVNPTATSFNPWVLDPTPTPSVLDADAVRGVDNLNNVEQVTIDNPSTGTYAVNVSGFSIPQGPQKYYVVYDFIYNTVELTYPIGGEGFAPGETETIRWDAFGTAGNFSLEYSITDGITWSPISSIVFGSTRSYLWNVPSVQSGQVKVRVSRGGSTSTSNRFTIVRVPTNLNVVSVCPDTITIGWSSISSISEYEVSMLGSQYMDSIGRTSSSTFKIGGLNVNEDHWFSVRAIGGDISGRRAYAIHQLPGVNSCVFSNNLAVSQIIKPFNKEVPTCISSNASPVSVKLANAGTNPITNIQLSYSVNGGTAVNETFTGTIAPGGNTTFTFTTPVDLSTAGTYNITVWSTWSSDQELANDTLSVSTLVYDGTSASLPMEQDFENFPDCIISNACETGLCDLAEGWRNGTNTQYDDIDWRTDAGGTTTGNTGPSQDFSPGTSTGKYVYLETGDVCNSKEAQLMTPCIDLTNAVSPSLTFGYHMFGTDMGQLYVDVMTADTLIKGYISPLFGNRGDEWKTGIVDLSPFIGEQVVITFRGITGSTGKTSDMALDAITISEPDGVSEFAQGMIRIVPNPSHGLFSIYLDPSVDVKNISIKNAIGQTISSDKVNTDFHQVNLSDYPSGMYYMEVTSGNVSTTYKLIKE